MVRVNAMLLAGTAAATFGFWAAFNRPVEPAAWPERIAGLAYAPAWAGADPTRAEFPPPENLDADLGIVATLGDSIRSYSVAGSLAELPRLAARHGLDVTVGVWLDADADAQRDAAQLARLRELVASNDNIERIIVGNETLLRAERDPAELGGLLDELRTELDVPVSTAEPWHVWLAHPELAEHVDYLAVHLLPYWEGVPVERAVDFAAARMAELEARFPELPVLIAEIGWPSQGRRRGEAVPSRRNAALFLRSFVARAQAEGYDYFLMEAFDQPWKRRQEGAVGAHWGIYDAERQAKLALAGPVRALPEWPALALLSMLCAALVFSLLLTDARGMKLRGRVFLAALAPLVASACVLAVNEYLDRYWRLTDVLAGAVLFAALLAMLVVVLVEAHEWAELRWSARRRVFAPRRSTLATPPKVSIHVPIHAEPPAMVIETLRALLGLEYPRYEVIVIDNNTDDAELWGPVAAFCARHELLRFFHVSPLAGYKAGALNFALARTAPDVDIVAVVDSDYKVGADWLRELVPCFDNAAVGIVQAPQAYRDGALGPFKSMCAAEYEGFFRIGMLTRNDRNAIIQHGTMTMIRRSVLDEVGGWAEWTITEDAELGLRVLEHGYEAVYVPRPYGRGLTPDNFLDYKMQRFRWALGAMQILRRHGKRLLGLEPSRLRMGQRFHFLTGWLAWLADGCNLLFNLVAIGWSCLMIAAPLRFEPPLAMFTAFVLAAFAFKLVKMLHLYRSEVRAGLLDTLGAAIAGLALVHVVGRAVIAGLGVRRARFLRTPKLADRHSLAAATAASRGETLLALGLLGAALGVQASAPFASLDRGLWVALLAVSAVPHLAALGLSLLSTLPAGRDVLAPRIDTAVTDARRG